MGDDEKAQATALLKIFQRELLVLVQREEFAPMPHIVITGLLEVAGTMMKNGVRWKPSSLPTFLQQLDQVRARIMPTEPTKH